MNELTIDILIVSGGLDGVAALWLDRTVILTEGLAGRAVDGAGRAAR